MPTFEKSIIAALAMAALASTITTSVPSEHADEISNMLREEGVSVDSTDIDEGVKRLTIYSGERPEPDRTDAQLESLVRGLVETAWKDGPIELGVRTEIDQRLKEYFAAASDGAASIVSFDNTTRVVDRRYKPPINKTPSKAQVVFDRCSDRSPGALGRNWSKVQPAMQVFITALVAEAMRIGAADNGGVAHRLPPDAGIEVIRDGDDIVIVVARCKESDRERVEPVVVAMAERCKALPLIIC